MEQLMVVGNKCQLFERKNQKNNTKSEFVEYKCVETFQPTFEVFQATEDNVDDFNKRMKELQAMLPSRKY